MRKSVLFSTFAVVLLTVFGASAQSVSTFKDSRDGKTYKTVKIGSQNWFAENLNFAAEGSVCYENKDTNCSKYGRLYDWATANKACPVGWHLASGEDWFDGLIIYIGGEETAGTKLKSSNSWNNNGNGMDNYGFSALPGGFGGDGNFYAVGSRSIWWVNEEDEDDSGKAWSISIQNNFKNVFIVVNVKTRLCSVRCVQN